MRYNSSDPYGLRPHNARIGNPHTVQHSPRYYFWQKLVITTLKVSWLLILLMVTGLTMWFFGAMIVRFVLGVI